MRSAARDLLKEEFKRAKWRVQIPKDSELDLDVESGGLRFGVVIKSATETRRPLLEGLLASAMLRARAAAKSGARPLAVIFAPSISEPVLEDLSNFASKYGDGIAWGAMDASGLVVLRGDGLSGVRGERRHARKPPTVQRVDQFSDLGQWMLKILFNHQLPPGLRIAIERADQPIKNANALSKAANVSVATAARFVVALKEEGFLVENQRFLRPIRVEQLLQRWQAIHRRRPHEVHARYLFPSKDPLRQLDALVEKAEKSGARACVGLFAACDRLGLHFVSGVAPHLYLDRLDALQELGLREAQAGEPTDVVVRLPRYPESVLRAALDRNGVRVADLLQCWLDVADHPARGEEMANHLYNEVIHPSLIEGAR